MSSSMSCLRFRNWSQICSLDPDSELNVRLLGEVGKNSFLALSGKQGHSGLIPSKLHDPYGGDSEESYSVQGAEHGQLMDFLLPGNEVSGGRHHPPSASNQSGVYVLVVSIQFPSPAWWRFQHLHNSSKIFLCVSLEWEGFPDSSVGEESACNAGDPGSISGSWRFAGERIGYPLQYSGLENSIYILYVHMYIYIYMYTYIH